MKIYKFLDNSMIKVLDETCRGCYLEKSFNLPREIEPIWINSTFCIRQDAECPVPGFYIIATRKHINTIANLTVNQSRELGILLFKLRFYMYNEINVNRAHIFLEERRKDPHLHIWMLPLWEDVLIKNDIDPKIWNSNILQYLQLFSYEENRDKIIKYNKIMREKMEEDIELIQLQ